MKTCHRPGRAIARALAMSALSARTLLLAAAFAFGFGASAALAVADEGEAASKRLVKLEISGTILEHGNPEFDLFAGPVRMTLIRDLRQTIHEIAKDDTVEGVVVEVGNVMTGMSERQAIRRELLALRESGKKTHAYLESGGLGTYLLASACTEVSLAPAGSIELPGIGLQKVFFAGLLEKLGLRMQELRMGRYKSAMESFTRDTPSDPVRQETEALVDSLYADLVSALAENLGIEKVAARALIDGAMYDADAALEAGLVHHVEYEDAMLARLRGESKLPVEKAGEDDGAPQTAGFAGMMQVFNELFSPSLQRELTEPRIVVVHATGAITSGGGAPNPLTGGAQGITSEEFVPLLRKLRDDETVRGVVFRVDSPGGSALASDLIAHEVAEIAKTKPIVVSMANLAASGGYYISAPASWIVAEPSTLTGSIGVIGGVLDTSRACEMAGVRFETFTRGKRAGMVDPYGRLTDDGREMIMTMMRDIYDQFLGVVADGRGLPKDAVASVAEGRVWTGSQAIELGLVDQLGSTTEALAKVRELSGAPEDIDVAHLPKPKTLFDILYGSPGASAVAAALGALAPEARSVASKIAWVWSLRDERVLAVLPDLIEVR